MSALDIERIEVLEGAAARSAGATAFTGVVNIVTRNERRGTTIAAAGGMYGYADAGLRISASGDRATGLRYDPATETFAAEPYLYLHNLLEMPCVATLFVLGVVLVLVGLFRALVKKSTQCGIWSAGTGTVLTVWAVLLLAGLNHTAYYPSSADPQASLCLANSCSSEFTLRT